MREIIKLEGIEDKYRSIINLDYDIRYHKRMPTLSRAGQFLPFSALEGYNDYINEITKISDSIKELDENKKEIINSKINYINKNIKLKPIIKITYFDSNMKKYITIENSDIKVDKYNRKIILNNIKINFDDILDINL